MSDIVKMDAPDDNVCLICGHQKLEHLNKVTIMRTIKNENIISFTVCDECLGRMAHDIVKYMN